VTHARPAAILLAAGLLLLALVHPLRADEPLRLYAAGSLRRALTEVTAAFTQSTGIRVEGTLGASGLLRDRLEAGERADVFASADMDHPRRLAAQGRAGAVTVFTRNRLCALVRPGLTATSEDLLDRMLDPGVRLGTSTPRADPSGDYAWAVFERAESVRAGARARLEAKAPAVATPGSLAGRSKRLYRADRERRRGPLPNLLHQRRGVPP
jgi:molybdate transport system substrate-binding protein